MMPSRTLLVSTIAFAAAQSSDQAMFDTMFGYIMPMIDGDNNNKVTHTEMDMMMTLLNIPQTELDSMCMQMSNPISPCNSAGLVTRYDADNDGELSRSEILTLAQQNQQVGPILIARVTGSGISSGGGGGGSDPMAEIAQSITTVPDGIKTASEKLETTLTVSGNRIWPGQREQVKDYFSTLWGIPKADIVLTVEPTTSSGRRLSTLTTSWDIKATGFFANAADVSAAQTATEAALPDAAAADAALPFVSVTSAPTVTTTSVAGVMPLPIASFALVVIPLLGGLLSITGACCMTCSKKEKEPVGGCCGCACTQTGCCSYYALPSWSFFLFLGLIIVIVGVVLLFLNMTRFANAISGIISVLESMRNQTSGPLADIARNIPADVLDIAKQVAPLLPIGAMVPGAITAFFLTIVSLCGCFKKKGGFCCAKFFMGLGYMCLMLSFSVYMLFAGLGIGLYVFQSMLRQFLGICDVGIPTLGQLSTDVTSSLEMIGAAGAGGAAATAAQEAVDQGQAIYDSFNGLCTHINGFILGVENMLFPSLLAAMAIAYTWFNTWGTCCGMGCCKDPHKGMKKIAPTKEDPDADLRAK